MYVRRFLESSIKKYLKDKEIIAIVGARQCGKTTLMQEIFKGLENAEFISFEDRDTLALFSKDVKSFIEKYVKGIKYLFIDEFQYAEQGGKNLKYIYDNYNTKIIISGSSVAELTVQSIKYLIGRIFVLTLYPFSFEEFLKFKDEKLYNIFKKSHFSEQIVEMINKYYYEYVIYGGYPRVVIEKDYEKKKQILKNIYNIYLLREIKEILQIAEDQKINQIIKALALQLGSLVNFTEVSNLTGVEFHKLKDYIEILQKTFIGFEAKPFFKNKRKEIAKAPKFYFLDNGLRNVAVNDFREINQRTDQGGLNENFVASEIIKKGVEIRYWRTKAKAEVDFIIEKPNEIVPIEIKSNIKEPKITRSFRNFIEEYNPEQGFLFSFRLNKKKTIKKTNVYFRPIAAVSKVLEAYLGE